MSAYTTVETLLDYMPLESRDQPTVTALGRLIERVSNLIDQHLGFSFGGDEAFSATLDGSGQARLWLVPPGAVEVLSVAEGGVVLSPALYELEPRVGRYLLRLDGANHISLWTPERRGVVVTLVPNPAPPVLEEYAIVECVRRWQGRTAGYPGLVGVGTMNERRASSGLEQSTIDQLERLALTYGAPTSIPI